MTTNMKCKMARGRKVRHDEVNQLIKQFGEMKKMMKTMSGGGRRGMSGMMSRPGMKGGMRMPR